MRKFLKSIHYGQRGFTLVELLIVIAILGVLAAVAIPSVAAFLNAGKEEAAKAEFSMVQAAVAAALAQDLTLEATLDTTDTWLDLYITGGAATLGYGPYTINIATGEVTAPVLP